MASKKVNLSNCLTIVGLAYPIKEVRRYTSGLKRHRPALRSRVLSPIRTKIIGSRGGNHFRKVYTISGAEGETRGVYKFSTLSTSSTFCIFSVRDCLGRALTYLIVAHYLWRTMYGQIRSTAAMNM